MSDPKPFRVDIAQSALDSIRQKVSAYEWREVPKGPGLEESWAYGTNQNFLRALCAHWADEYDWRQWERALNRFPQFTAQVDGLDLHFFHEEGSGPDPQPIILSHGWPGSVFEFLHLIEPLAHPERFGGDAEDAFTVIVPSLPGYGFSGKPERPISPRTIARAFDALMIDVLALPDYIAQGGDWGSAISGWLGYEGKGCRAVHLNMMGWVSPGVGPQTDEEKEHAKKARQLYETRGTHFRVHARNPETISYAMMDSPVGACAYIVEKFHSWSDIRRGFENVYTRDQLLTNVMIYLVTRSFNTALWLYRGLYDDAGGPPVPAGARVERPVAIAHFPVDVMLFPPRSQVERSFNVTRWSDFAEGGHFAALERPDDLLGDIRAFARELRP